MNTNNTDYLTKVHTLWCYHKLYKYTECYVKYIELAMNNWIIVVDFNFFTADKLQLFIVFVNKF